jgi:hypothetical protein
MVPSEKVGEMQISCSCGKKLQVKEALAGKRVKCPDSGAAVPARETVARPKVMAACTSRAGAEEESPPQKTNCKKRVEENGDGPRRRPARKKQPTKKSPGLLPVFIGGGVLLVALFGLGLFLVFRPNQPDTSRQTKGPPPNRPQPPGMAGGPGGAPGRPPAGPGAPSTPAEQALAVGAEQLGQEYERDRATADQKYKGKLLAVEGIVHLNNISHPLFSVELQTSRQNEGKVLLAVCYLRRDLEGRLSHDAVKIDQKAALRGRCEGLDQVDRVVLRDCEIIPVGSAGGSPSAAKPSSGVGQQAWRELRSPEGRFSILFPTQATHDKEGAQHRYVASAGGGQIIYVVSVDPLAEGAGDPRGVLAQFAQGGARPNSKVTSKKDITLGQNPGIEWTEEWNEGAATVNVGRAYVAGGNIYQLVITCPKARLPVAEAEKFFNSFKPL